MTYSWIGAAMLTAQQKPEAEHTTNKQTQQRSCTSTLNFLFGNKLFQETQDFKKQVTVITALSLVAKPIALCPISVIASRIMKKHDYS